MDFERLRARVRDLQNLGFEAVSTLGEIADEVVSDLAQGREKTSEAPKVVVNMESIWNAVNDQKAKAQKVMEEVNRKIGEAQQAQPAPEPATGGSDEHPSLDHVLSLMKQYLVGEGYYNEVSAEGIPTLWAVEDFKDFVMSKIRKGEM